MSPRSTVKQSAFYAVIMLGIIVMSWAGPTFRHMVWVHESFHSMIEAVGMVLACIIAAILLLDANKRHRNRRILFAVGFLSMGILDGFHAVTMPGESFVFFHSVASLIGAFFFILGLMIPSEGYGRLTQVLGWGGVCSAVSIGVLGLLRPSLMPLMLIAGRFSPYAIAINVTAGVLFIVVAFLFLWDFHISGQHESHHFFLLTLFFGIAELTFMYSSLWTIDWWLWHGLRLSAYLLAGGYIVVHYKNMSTRIDILAVQKEADEQFKKRNEFLTHILESIPNPFYVIDVNNYTIEMANSACHIFNIKNNVTCYKATHQSTVPCHQNGDECPLKEVLRTKQSVMVEHIHRDQKGNVHVMQVYGYPICDTEGKVIQMAEYAVDITQQRQAEMLLREAKEKLEIKVKERTQELERSQSAMLYMVEDLNRQTHELQDAQERIVRSGKLAAIGQLASSVAHELRNPLGAMKNAIYYFNMLELGKDDPDIKENLDILAQEIEKSDKIIGDLLEFSRVKKPIIRPENINHVVREIVHRLPKPEGIDISTHLDEGIPSCEVDALQIQQVFYNLATNAIQAMGEQGVLTIKTMVHEGYSETHFIDTGCGIPDNERKKIFEPLFSTKAKGTGLGLSVCMSIIEGHRGAISVASAVGKGTTFIVKLPLERT